jgi:hypothetical protein
MSDDPQVESRELRRAQAEHVLRFTDLEEAYAEAQAKVQAGEASDEDRETYNRLGDEVVAERQAGRAIRDRLKVIEGVPEGDGVAEPDVIEGSISINGGQ